MPQRSMHRAAGNGVPRRVTALYESSTGIVTTDDWENPEHLSAEAREALNLARDVSDLIPTHAGNRGLEELNALLRSDQLVNFRQSMRRVPMPIRPRSDLSPLDAVRVALVLAGKLVRRQS